MKKIFIVDNYDSFTYNIYQYLGILGVNVIVKRNDEFKLHNLKRKKINGIIISPGPSRPEKAGLSVKVVKEFAGEIPILGVCLGHQSIAYAFGAKIIRAEKVMHGKTSEIYHDGKTIFYKIENPFIATRYHSLIVDEKTLSEEFEISARTIDGEIMGIRHKSIFLEGVQFHPESVLTQEGLKIFKNFVERL